MTNVERAKQYEIKSSLLGINRFSFYTYEKSDTVTLESVTDGTGDIEIPDFVTSIDGEAFSGTHYTQVKFKGPLEDLAYTFAGIHSEKIKVIYPFDNLSSIQGMFYGCLLTKEIDLSDCDLSNVTNASFAFCDTEVLESLTFSNREMTAVEHIGYMFFQSSKLKEFNCDKLFGTHIKILTNAFRKSSIEDLSIRNLSNTPYSEVFGARPTDFLPSGLKILRAHKIPYWAVPKSNTTEMELQHIYFDIPQVEVEIRNFLIKLNQKHGVPVTIHNGASKIFNICLS